MIFRKFFSRSDILVQTCKICGEKKPLSSAIGICKDCITKRFNEAYPYLRKVHSRVRERYNLPQEPPNADNGIKCNLCSNNCRIGVGEKGYCGLRYNDNGKLISYSTIEKAPLISYLDPHITNCCASWFCPGGTGLGYPDYAVQKGPERGYYNLAVFFYGCNFSCLFCQNWEHKQIDGSKQVDAEKLANIALGNSKVTCICYFGGSPEPHLPYTINVNKKILERKGDRIIRICYEWNGAGNSNLVKTVGKQVLESGGIIKFDLKAPNNELSYALSGVRNDTAFRNFKMLYDLYWHERPEVPIITATTLLVPGYIGPEEVEEIAKFISEINRKIPYSLLVFHPAFILNDLPITPKKVAIQSLERARRYLDNVHLGNQFLLGLAPNELI